MDINIDGDTLLQVIIASRERRGGVLARILPANGRSCSSGLETPVNSMKNQGSEIARLRQQITEEIEAMKLGFSGLATGSARHDFIRARMEQVGSHLDELAEHVGNVDAVQMACEIYINTVADKDEVQTAPKRG
ncbi:hypothetical protein EPA93_25645 [Ktedonosporobacter rubrisoli]|uniref:Uncharacterized protein n=1 Tax=Ktedonosporobacter rubrisoli TaxID=2509675 RepID=A0A4P6JU81_KTERU|nr:hypothetical protein [Ktedonosporobacter rubrisoli]QBD79179.1 hypothetical protein EPA93_25645 [Ktedonosporobacter rubrisoli]